MASRTTTWTSTFTRCVRTRRASSSGSLSLSCSSTSRPLAPLIQRGGGQIDVQAILRLVGHYADLPEIAEIVIFVDHQAAEGAEQSTMPVHTSREYVPRGSPGMTQRGASANIQQLLVANDDGG